MPASVSHSRANRNDLRQALRSIDKESIAAMLYGSRARGAARPDSDIDVLQIVGHNPRTYSSGQVNVTAYTAEHLRLLAERGSLFVRHLKEEGVILFDPDGVLTNLLEAYRPPADYDHLKGELSVMLGATGATDAAAYAAGVTRLGVYATRTALYIRAAEANALTFDLDAVCNNLGLPELSNSLRKATFDDLLALRSLGPVLLGVDRPTEAPTDLASLALWAMDNYPMASAAVEHVLGGASCVDYATMMLPA